jgi:uncharacterized membrane protein YvbJ
MFCAYCGTQILSNSSFCHRCGKQVFDLPPAPSNGPPASTDSKGQLDAKRDAAIDTMTERISYQIKIGVLVLALLFLLIVLSR